MTKYSIFSTFTNSTAVGLVFLALMAFGLAFGAAQTVLGQKPSKVSLKVGGIVCNKLKKTVSAGSVGRPTFSRPSIVHAWFNRETQFFCFEGLKEGETRVTFTGVYTADGNTPPGGGGGMSGGIGGQQGGDRFTTILDFTVLPRGEAVINPNAFATAVVRGKHVDLPIEAALGLPADNRPVNQVRWRGIVVTGGENSIARVIVLNMLNAQAKIRVTGVGPGKTTLMLEGEVLKTGGWQLITRPIEVTVSDGPTAQVQADPWIDGMQRRLQDLKRNAGQAGTDERKINSSVQALESFVTPVRAAITKERARENEREWRLARLENLRDEANNELVKLRSQHAEIAKQVRIIGWHQMLADLDIVLGKRPVRRTFTCPPNPNKSHGIAYGTDWYTENSAICAAAVHAGVIGFDGGNIIVEFRAGIRGDNFMGSKRRGVESHDYNNWSYGSLAFIKTP